MVAVIVGGLGHRAVASDEMQHPLHLVQVTSSLDDPDEEAEEAEELDATEADSLDVDKSILLPEWCDPWDSLTVDEDLLDPISGIWLRLHDGSGWQYSYPLSAIVL